MRKIRSACLVLLLVLASACAHASIRVASWNLLHLGWGHSKNLDSVAAVINRFDLVAIEEVMDPAAVKTLTAKLSSVSDSQWNSVTSRAIGRGSYKEYAFVWRESAVDFEGGATVYLDPGDVFARQPLSAVFSDRDDGQRFVFAAVHILYGDGRSDRTPEIRALADYWNWLEASFDAPVVLAGDFNMEPDDPSWRFLGNDAGPLIRRGATTLSSHDNRYSHLYDNIWVRQGQLNVTGSGIARFPAWLGINHRNARKHISDHAPVYMTLGRIAVDGGASGNSGSTAVSSTAKNCVDLNTASVERLTMLVHVGPARAQAIVAGRPWKSVSDLTRVRGIGAARVDNIRSEGRVCR